MATNKDYKRTTENKAATVAVRTERRNRRTEQKFTDRSFSRLLTKGL